MRIDHQGANVGIREREVKPIGARLSVGRPPASFVRDKRLVSDFARFERNGFVVGVGEDLAADLVDVLSAPLNDHGHGRQGHAHRVDVVERQAATPTPIGQTTPVPPMPQ